MGGGNSLDATLEPRYRIVHGYVESKISNDDKINI
jgi:hypothetical protein